MASLGTSIASPSMYLADKPTVAILDVKGKVRINLSPSLPVH